MSKKETKNPRMGVVGGQAVLEGVMMRHKDRYSVAVRKEDGTINVSNHTFSSIRKKYKILNIPILRGVINMIEMFKLSFKTMAISAEAMGIEEVEDTKFEKWLREKFGRGVLDFIMAVASVLGVVLAVVLFMFLPIFLTKQLDGVVGGIGWLKNLIEGLIKVLIFVLYIWGVSFMSDIRRTFEYHGSEHKSIFCYEAGEELIPENVRKFSRFHPRCGTSFIFVMIAISIIINSLPFVTWDNMVLRLITKLLLMPVIIGVGYEFLMYAGKHDNILVRILSAPGLWMQRLTTREPSDEQIEVAIAALKHSMPEEFPEINNENTDVKTAEISDADKEETVSDTSEEERSGSFDVPEKEENSEKEQNETDIG